MSRHTETSTTQIGRLLYTCLVSGCVIALFSFAKRFGFVGKLLHWDIIKCMRISCHSQTRPILRALRMLANLQGCR